MKKNIIIGFITLLIVLTGFYQIYKPTDKSAKQTYPKTESEVDHSQQNINKLFSKIPTDTYPENTLDIPKEQWTEKNEALAYRALKYFQSKGNASVLIPDDQVEFRQGYLMAWGKPWRLHYLKNNLSDAELKMVWDEELLVLAETPEELANLEKETQEKLARVNPPVEANPDQFKDYFTTQEEINKGVVSGRLAKVSMKNVKDTGELYVDKELAEKLKNIDEALKDSTNIYEISSATRAADMQALLRKLGYPAAKFSFHNLGNAIDFKLQRPTAEKLKDYMDGKHDTSGKVKPQIVRLDEMVKAGTYPIMEILINENVLPQDHEITKAYKALKTEAQKQNVEMYDEMPFFLNFDKEGKLESINPVLHLQIRK